ncbi:RxLR effector protein [Phytophthora megakarya]|uniref:RxLR effector protein n=1 Tax=Phytophthora megakarya TaxID=4795 RepID=A0A225W473_9STRA|nr:RxLR effector protein [Phytophthora megakarya]
MRLPLFALLVIWAILLSTCKAAEKLPTKVSSTLNRDFNRLLRGASNRIVENDEERKFYTAVQKIKNIRPTRSRIKAALKEKIWKILLQKLGLA